MQWVAKELAIVLPYLFHSDLQYNLRQGWRHAFNGYCDHCSWKKLNNWLQCRSSLQCCNQSVHVYQNCLEQSQKHVFNGAYGLTTIWRPGLMNLTQCMLCVQIYCVCIGLLFAVFSTVNRIGLVYVLESSVSVEYSWRSGYHKLSIYIDYSNFQPKNSTFSETLTEKFQNLQVNC